MLIRTAIIALACAASPGGHAVADTPKNVNVQAGHLSEALKTLAKQCGVYVIYPSIELKGVKTSGVSGTFETLTAFRKLIEGTQLVMKEEGGAILISLPQSNVVSDGGFDNAQMPTADGAARLAQAETASSSPSQREGAPKGADEEKSKIQEIVVTAQKRGEERLQDVPISISVLSGQQLDKSSFQGVTEALNSVPGVATMVGGQTGGAQIGIRGVTAPSDIFTGSSPIAYYLDSASFGMVRSAFTPDLNAYDLAQIELLRGPQGTLYGASALNGVVRVLSHEADLNKVDFKMRAGGSSTSDGGDNYRGDAAVNVPIIEGKVAARAVVGYQDWSGWIDSRNAEDVNKARLRNYRLKIDARPKEGFSMGLSWWRSDNDYDAPSTADDDGQNRAVLPQPNALTSDAYALNASYRTSAFSVSGTTSYLDYKSRGRLDGNPFGLNFILTTDLDSQVFSQEVLFRSEGEGAWRWSAGAFYRDAEDLTFQEILFPTVSVQQNNFSDYSESAAVYGELSRRFADDKLEWTLGARYFHDKIKTEANSPAPAGQAAFVGVPISDSFDSTTPRVVLSWYPTADWTAYASFSQGFRSGIPQFPSIAISHPEIPSFAKPDKLRNYEIGSKGNFLNRRVTVEAALFYIDWQDVQQTLAILNANGTGTPAVVNGVSASGLGADLGLQVELINDFRIGVNLGWNDLTQDEDVISGGNLLFEKGERLNRSPEHTLGASFQYDFSLGGSGYQGRWSAATAYTSKQNNTSLSGTARVFSQGDSILMSRTALSVDTPHDWTVILYIDNLNDERGTQLINPSASTSPRLRPRTVGLQFEYHMGRQ